MENNRILIKKENRICNSFTN